MWVSGEHCAESAEFPVIKTTWTCGSILWYKMATEKISCRGSSLSPLMSLSLSLFVGMWDSGYHHEDVLWVFVFTHDSLLRFTASINGDLPVAHIDLTTCAMKWWYSNPPSQLSVHKTLQASREQEKKHWDTLLLSNNHYSFATRGIF